MNVCEIIEIQEKRDINRHREFDSNSRLLALLNRNFHCYLFVCKKKKKRIAKCDACVIFSASRRVAVSL